MRWKLFFLLLFVGCGVLHIKKSRLLLLSGKPKVDIVKYVSPNCLSSSGVGRLTIGEENHQFRYESFNNLDTNHWALGLYFSLMGEEVVRLNYAHQKISGSFYERINQYLEQNQKEGSNIELMSDFKSSLSIFLRLIKDIKNQNFIERCQILKNDLKKQILKFNCYDRFTGHEKIIEAKFQEDIITFISPMNDSFEMELSFQDNHQGQWRQTQLTLRKNTWWSQYPLFNIVLQAHSCQ